MKLNFIFLIHHKNESHNIMKELSPFIGQSYKRENMIILEKHNIIEKLMGTKLPLNKFYFAIGYDSQIAIEERFNERFEMDSFLKWTIWKPKRIEDKKDLVEIPC
jgi:hypothetical protein